MKGITDFNLEIFNSSGTRVAKSMLGTKSNVELIRYTAASSGTYTIKVTMTGGQNANIESDCVALTYNVQ
ncbi:MAG: T9SS type A sorting domain-containing protein [Clostridia bacterium]|nr:T9SS type A sorting domain-containing protein [Clostridia bacterium]